MCSSPPPPPVSKVLPPQIQPIVDWKYSEKEIPESSKKQNLNLLHASNYLHSIYIVLGVVSNLDMIYSNS